MKYDKNLASESFAKMFGESIEALSELSAIKPTNCHNLSIKMRNALFNEILTIDSYFDATGHTTIFGYKEDGQKYIMTIKPLK